MIEIENLISQNIKNFMELPPFFVVSKVFAQHVVDVHGITCDHEVHVSEPRTLKLESSSILF